MNASWFLNHPLMALKLGAKAHPFVTIGVCAKLLLTAGAVYLIFKKRNGWGKATEA